MTDLLIGLALAVATRYTDQGTTYCGRHTSQLPSSWLAVPVEQIGGLYQCGDLVYIRGDDWSLLARVQDAGPFGNNFVTMEDGRLAPILFDIGNAPFDELSAELDGWTNITERARTWQKSQKPN